MKRTVCNGCGTSIREGIPSCPICGRSIGQSYFGFNVQNFFGREDYQTQSSPLPTYHDPDEESPEPGLSSKPNMRDRSSSFSDFIGHNSSPKRNNERRGSVLFEKLPELPKFIKDRREASQLRKEIEILQQQNLELQKNEKDLKEKLLFAEQQLVDLHFKYSQMSAEASKMRDQISRLEREIVAICNIQKNSFSEDELQHQYLEKEKQLTELKIRYRETLTNLGAHIEALPTLLDTVYLQERSSAPQKKGNTFDPTYLSQNLRQTQLL